MQFADPAVTAEFDTGTKQVTIPNFGTSIFAQTLVNTSSLDFAGAVRFGIVEGGVHVTVA